MELLEWQLTPWRMKGNGTWKLQPAILIEGQPPFCGQHPDDYVAKLQDMQNDVNLARGPFYTLAGQLKDARDQHWRNNEKSTD